MFEVPEPSESSGAVAIMALRPVTEFVTIEVTVEHPQWWIASAILAQHWFAVELTLAVQSRLTVVWSHFVVVTAIFSVRYLLDSTPKVSEIVTSCWHWLKGFVIDEAAIANSDECEDVLRFVVAAVAAIEKLYDN